MMQRQKGAQPLFLCFYLLMLGGSVGTVKGADLAQKCSNVANKVTPCLSFVTGQLAAPSKECCSAATEIKDDEPECLCSIIQQIHKGSPEIKSLHIQEAKLLQLPTACNLKNASITNCPKLLGLSPSSPDAAIFTNVSSGNSSAATGGNTSSQSQNQSDGSMLRPPLVADLMVMVLVSAILLVVIQTGFVGINS